MNYPPANLWTQIQLEQLPEPEPQLIQVTADLALPAAWPEERRAEFLRLWQES